MIYSWGNVSETQCCQIAHAKPAQQPPKNRPKISPENRPKKPTIFGTYFAVLTFMCL